MIGGPDEWMPQPLVKALFHVSLKTLRRWQEEKGFPKPFYLGPTAFYRAMEIRLWQEKQVVNTQEPPQRKKRKPRENSGQDETP